MICPYMRKKETCIMQETYDPDDDGRNRMTQKVDSYEYTMLECPKEGCAVWFDGRCHYYADNV